ncbi:uncharacterized protein (DUF1810 family) [Rhizobium lusitanum]|uniref:Uncharacterized protein (DUF1810 family) n=1 Tax=Rhizobium lusitanum TaxID=293958 RepID=A0A7X0IV10_9HYPH|nr:uncharacterized protein (DUF1810 family) [Rhizobium lusitanum]
MNMISDESVRPDIFILMRASRAEKVFGAPQDLKQFWLALTVLAPASDLVENLKLLNSRTLNSGKRLRA